MNIPKKFPAQFLIPIALLLGSLIVILAIINTGKDQAFVPENEGSGLRSESMGVEDTGQVKSPQGSNTDHSSEEAIAGGQLKEPAVLEEQPSDAPPSGIAEARFQRELTKAKIAAEYSSAGDGTLTEADFRRYAEERYLKRHDLNGNGKLDGFELRAISRRQNGADNEASSTTNNPREL